MAFDDVIKHLDKTDTVAIVTTRADGTEVPTPIWSVVLDGVPYVRSAYGDGSKWYQHALSGRDVKFALGDGKVAERDRAASLAQPSEEVRVEHVSTDEVIRAVSDEVASKYSDQPSSVEPMLSDAAIGCTLRVLEAR